MSSTDVEKGGGDRGEERVSVGKCWIPKPFWRWVIELVYLSVFVCNVVCVFILEFNILARNPDEVIGSPPELHKQDWLGGPVLPRLRMEIWCYFIIEILIVMLGCVMKCFWNVLYLLPVMVVGVLLKILPYFALQWATSSLFYAEVLLPHQNEVGEFGTLWNVKVTYVGWVFVWSFVQYGVCILVFWSVYRWQRDVQRLTVCYESRMRQAEKQFGEAAEQMVGTERCVIEKETEGGAALRQVEPVVVTGNPFLTVTYGKNDHLFYEHYP